MVRSGSKRRTAGSANLRQVADRAGVSLSTASRVLNDQQTSVPISEGTRLKVLQAARELGYVPSAAARALRRGSTRTIGVLGDSPEDFLRAVDAERFGAEMLRALMQSALRERIHLLLLTGTSERAGSYNTRMAELGMVDGLLVYNRDLSRGRAYMDAVTGSGKPLVYLLEYPESGDACVCAPDDVQGGRLAAEKLLQAGHRRIGFLSESSYYPGVFNRRRAGWAEALRAAGADPEPSWTISLSSLNPEEFKRARLTALVCPNDMIANAFRTRVAPSLGLSVPGDIAMVTFAYDCSLPGPKVSTPMAYVTTPLAPIVACAVTMLTTLISGQPVSERRFHPPFRFVPGVLSS